jgi:hypothetical protein
LNVAGPAPNFRERPGTWVTNQTGHIGYTFVTAERRLDDRFEFADGPTTTSARVSMPGVCVGWRRVERRRKSSSAWTQYAETYHVLN